MDKRAQCLMKRVLYTILSICAYFFGDNIKSVSNFSGKKLKKQSDVSFSRIFHCALVERVTYDGDFQAVQLTAYIVGHIPPGSDERQKGTSPSNHVLRYSEHHNKMYLKIVRKFASIIVGQFFGHLHSDTFRVIYNEKGHPISWAMLAPSITPKRTHDGPNNPGLRLYKFDKDTGQVFDYTQYYLDLSSANYNGRAEWVVEYNFSTYYGINDITPSTLHALADKLTHYSDSENSYFNRYYRANSVKINTRTAANCDDTCAHAHYCAITRVDYDDHEQCLKTAASALSSSTQVIRPSRKVFCTFIVLFNFVAMRYGIKEVLPML